jgi:CheY-like chemotaxis protein
VIQRVFQNLGYTMTIGNNGMEALQIIEERGMPDMIVMDVQMYGKRGGGKRGGRGRREMGEWEREKKIRVIREERKLKKINRPILDGVQTTKIIRSKYPNTWVYIVAMTANAFPGRESKKEKRRVDSEGASERERE